MGPKAVRINVYYSGGGFACAETVNRIGEVLRELGVAGDVRAIPINPIWASFLHFVGSPTVHVNGRDIEPSARMSSAVGFSYRTYRNGQQIEGVPSKTMIREALLEARTQVFVIPARALEGSSPSGIRDKSRYYRSPLTVCE